jgi:hypothetical protein
VLVLRISRNEQGHPVGKFQLLYLSVEAVNTLVALPYYFEGQGHVLFAAG